jgi:hypothetical protein
MAEKLYNVYCANDTPPKHGFPSFSDYIKVVATTEEKAEKYAKRILKYTEPEYVYHYFKAKELKD